MQDQPTLTSWLIVSQRVERALLAFAGLCALLLALTMGLSSIGAGRWRAFDEWLLRALRTAADPGVAIGSRSFQIAVRDMTALGGVLPLTVLVAIVAVYLMLKGHWRTGGAVVASVALGVLASQVLKSLIDRGRPDIVPQLVPEISGSFPSGHAMMSAIVYLTLGAMLARLEPERAVRRFVIGTAMAITVAVGLSRVYLGVHWPSDVIGGWCLGALWVIAVSRTLDAAIRRVNGA